MNHLKQYKLFERLSIKDIIDDIHDICLELEDEGYPIRIVNMKELTIFDHMITKGKYRNSYVVDVRAPRPLVNAIFEISSIQDVLQRLYHYSEINDIKLIFFILENYNIATVSLPPPWKIIDITDKNSFKETTKVVRIVINQ